MTWCTSFVLVLKGRGEGVARIATSIEGPAGGRVVTAAGQRLAFGTRGAGGATGVQAARRSYR
jgi:hypothetical protein